MVGRSACAPDQRFGGQVQDDGAQAVALADARGRHNGDKLPTSDELERVFPVDVRQYGPEFFW